MIYIEMFELPKDTGEFVTFCSAKESRNVRVVRC